MFPGDHDGAGPVPDATAMWLYRAPSSLSSWISHATGDMRLLAAHPAPLYNSNCLSAVIQFASPRAGAGVSFFYHSRNDFFATNKLYYD